MPDWSAFMHHRLILCLLAALAAAPQARAQYVWIDDKGLKQLSDRPPPPNVPAKRILKAPPSARQTRPPIARPPATTSWRWTRACA